MQNRLPWRRNIIVGHIVGDSQEALVLQPPMRRCTKSSVAFAEIDLIAHSVAPLSGVFFYCVSPNYFKYVCSQDDTRYSWRVSYTSITKQRLKSSWDAVQRREGILTLNYSVHDIMYDHIDCLPSTFFVSLKKSITINTFHCL